MNANNSVKENQESKRGFADLDQRTVLLAIIFGLAGLLGSFLSYNLKFNDFNITLHWSLIFPLIIALVYGWRYALISVIFGGVWLFPFFCWPGDGWANVYNMMQFSGWIIWHGYFSDLNRSKPSWETHIFTAQVYYLLIYIFPQLFIFPLFFRFNPPSWSPGAELVIPHAVVLAIAIKSIFLQFFYVNLSYTLLLFPFVKRILHIPIKKSSFYNGRIILGSLFMGVLICQFLTLINIIFVKHIQGQLIQNMFTYQLSIDNLVIFLSCILAGNIFAKFIETRLEMGEEYKESEKRFKIVFDNARIGIALDDLKNDTVTNNPMIIHNLGFSDEEYNAMTFRDFTHPDDLQKDLENYQLLRKGKLDSYQLEKRFIHKNGQVVWGKLTVSTVKGADGGMEYILTMVEDITEAKLASQKISNLNAELENRVRERTSELELSNKELETFAYTISHDLRAPLRNINGWSNILAEEFSMSLDANAKTYISHLCSESIRMAELIDALLELSRVSRIPLKYQKVDLSHIAESILGNFRLQETERNVEYTIAQELIAEGDPALLHNILSNLLGNAWKFSAKEAISRIEVNATMLNNNHVFFVRDNGVGFDMKYADQLFKPFHRLHLVNEFPGSGIGLASVSKIIQRHKGRIWIESEEGKGTTIFFTLNDHSSHKAIATIS